MPKIINNFHDIIPDYDLFIVDIFGVIHDGLELYPEVFENIQEIKKQNKHFVFLSNAPRRAKRAAQTLHDFGITPDLYDFIMTSGEHAFNHFKALEQQNKIIKYYYLGPDKDKQLLFDTKHILVDNPHNADIAVSTGLEPEQQVTDIIPEITQIKAANLELYCINPDKFVNKQSGKSHICAGAIADYYKELGGKISYYGKPYLSIYEHIIKQFPQINKNKILCIGDGLDTDIKGANNANLTSVLITSGMHVKEFNTDIGILPQMDQIENIVNKYNSRPSFVASLF